MPLVVVDSVVVVRVEELEDSLLVEETVVMVELVYTMALVLVTVLVVWATVPLAAAPVVEMGVLAVILAIGTP